MGSRTIGIDADLFVHHESPPDAGQHHQLQHDGDDEVAEETVLGGFHTLIGIKMHATRMAGRKASEINHLQFNGHRHGQTDSARAMPDWRRTAKLTVERRHGRGLQTSVGAETRTGLLAVELTTRGFNKLSVLLVNDASSSRRKLITAGPSAARPSAL
jgi:hypothetical protein